MWYLYGIGISFAIIVILLIFHISNGEDPLNATDLFYIVLFSVLWPLFIVIVMISLMQDRNKWPA